MGTTMLVEPSACEELPGSQEGEGLPPTREECEALFNSGFAITIIRRCAKRLAHSKHFQTHEQEDLEQDFRLVLWKALQSFDSRVSHFNSYATTVIANRAQSLRRQRKSRKWGGDKKIQTINESISDLDSTELSTQLDTDDGNRRLRTFTRSEIELTRLRLDVETILGDAPDSLVEIAEALQNLRPFAAAARLNISRQTLNRRIHSLLKKLEKAQLNEYL